MTGREGLCSSMKRERERGGEEEVVSVATQQS